MAWELAGKITLQGSTETNKSPCIDRNQLRRGWWAIEDSNIAVIRSLFWFVAALAVSLAVKWDRDTI
jgi:hypothetical protein